MQPQHYKEVALGYFFNVDLNERKERNGDASLFNLISDDKVRSCLDVIVQFSFGASILGKLL